MCNVHGLSSCTMSLYIILHSGRFTPERSITKGAGKHSKYTTQENGHPSPPALPATLMVVVAVTKLTS